MITTAETPSCQPSTLLPASGTNGKFAYADVLRAFAAFAVVMIHVSGQGVVHTELVSKFSWWVAIFFDGISRWSVPVFVMVSGALLLGSSKQESIWDFYRKRASRIGIPLVFWTAVFLVWRRFYVPEPDLTLAKMGRAIFYGVPAFHLYFLFLIFGLYIFTPLFRTFVRNASPAELWVITVAALTLTAVSHIARMFLGGWIQWSSVDLFVPYVGFFLAGYAIVNTRLPDHWERFFRVFNSIMLVISLLVIISGVGFTKGERQLNRSVEIFYQYPYPPVMVMTLCVFAIVVDLYRNPGPIRRRISSICSWIAPASFGVYLIHPILLWEIFKHHGMPVYPNTLIAVPAWTLALFAACLTITKIIQLIPVLRRTVG